MHFKKSFFLAFLNQIFYLLLNIYKCTLTVLKYFIYFCNDWKIIRINYIELILFSVIFSELATIRLRTKNRRRKSEKRTER